MSTTGAQNPQPPKEYSIFVGHLVPVVSNSDLVAFCNPVLGLRNDRESRFIRPFLSRKSSCSTASWACPAGTASSGTL